MSCASILLSYPQAVMAADGKSANKAEGTLALVQGCHVIKKFDETAPQWFSDLRGPVEDKKKGNVTYESTLKFPGSITNITEYADGNTSGNITMGGGKTSDKLRKLVNGMDKILNDCFASKVVNAKNDFGNDMLMSAVKS